jgi:hypothetical protein
VTARTIVASRALLEQKLPDDAAFAELRVGMGRVGPLAAAGSTAGAARARLLAELLGGAVPCADAELVELEWAEQRSATADAQVRLVSTITRLGPAAAGGARVGSDLRVVDGEGVELQRGRASWRVPSAQLPDQDPVRVALELGSVPWGRRIAERLAANEAFRSTTTPFDGAIGFSSGPDEVSFRIYRGVIVEVARKAVDGPTFTIGAPELTWLSLLTSPMNDFVRRTGAFKVRGNGFQYVRMIKAIMLILDEARAELAEVLDA